MTTIPAIQTVRLTLRPLATEDAPVLYQIYKHAGVLRFFPNPIPPPVEKVERFIASQQKHWERYGCGNWAVVPSGQQELIGWAGLQFLPELNATEVGFLLDLPYWGKGYATEAARAGLEFGFGQCGLPHITALVHADNLASQRVLTKCGLAYIVTTRLWGLDLLRYQIAKETYELVRAY